MSGFDFRFVARDPDAPQPDSYHRDAVEARTSCAQEVTTQPCDAQWARGRRNRRSPYLGINRGATGSRPHHRHRPESSTHAGPAVIRPAIGSYRRRQPGNRDHHAARHLARRRDVHHAFTPKEQ